MALVPVAGRLEPYDGAGGRVVDEILDEVHLGTADPDRGIRTDAKHGSLVRCGLVFCQVGVGRFGVSFSPCERRVSGRFGVGRSCWLLVIALVIA